MPPLSVRRLLAAAGLAGGALLPASLPGCAAWTRSDECREDVVHVDTTRPAVLARKANKAGLHWLAYGDLHLARKSFEKSVRRDPHFAPAHNNLGKMLFDAGDMASAAAAFDEAIARRPTDPVPHNNLGLALENGGRAVDALMHYEMAHNLDPASPEFLGNLIRARMKLDPYDESVVPLLRELRFLETRPEWIDWIEEQLAIRFNPYLDRGPADPDLSALEDMDDPAEPEPVSVLNVPDLGSDFGSDPGSDFGPRPGSDAPLLPTDPIEPLPPPREISPNPGAVLPSLAPLATPVPSEPWVLPPP